MSEKKVWKKEEIKDLLERNDVAVITGLIRIFELQTEAEKALNMTHDANGVGFSGVDGEIMTSIANQYLKWGSISEKQFVIVKKKMGKYAKQLARIANGDLLPVHMRRKVEVRPDWIRKSKKR